MAETSVVQRIVPGAPPPVALTKSQKKKRRTTKAGGAKSEHEQDESTSPSVPPTSSAIFPDVAPVTPTEKAPEAQEDAAFAPGLVSRSESQAPPLPEEDLLKASPIVDLVNKRFKATTKKISRISAYANTDIEKLNDDQKRSLKTLPTLDTIQKELGEVKKAIEAHEQELAQDLTVKRLEAEKAERARINNAVSAAKATLITRTGDVFNILRLRSLLNSDNFDISSVAEPSEVSALLSITDTLLGEDLERRQLVISGLVQGVGDFEGVLYTRLLDISQQALISLRASTPEPEESVEVQQEEESSLESGEEEVSPVTGIPAATTSITASIQFIQVSEIEPAPFEEGAEWVERPDTIGHTEPRDLHEEAAPVAEEPTENVNGPIDWAADEEAGLPSIAGLQAEFGASGSATPVDTDRALAAVESVSAAEKTNGQANGAPGTSGYTTNVGVDEEGFTQMKGRGRGGRGGYRGGDRGHRGFHQGHFKGGERGGGHRTGERGGFRGGPRGGERGGFRGGRGGGEWRGDGERGRGRGRGRGDRSGHHNAPPTPA